VNDRWGLQPSELEVNLVALYQPTAPKGGDAAPRLVQGQDDTYLTEQRYKDCTYPQAQTRLVPPNRNGALFPGIFLRVSQGITCCFDSVVQFFPCCVFILLETAIDVSHPIDPVSQSDMATRCYEELVFSMLTIFRRLPIHNRLCLLLNQPACLQGLKTNTHLHASRSRTRHWNTTWSSWWNGRR
jgi:hypothetical protein